ncbi:Uncharacterised protein [Yersinia enterocolitica]|nr:Uncharacterised protein [Yersinia enterocolitica]
MHRHEIGVIEAESFGVIIHQANKTILTTSNIIRQRDAGIITRLDHNTFIQVGQFHLIARFQKHQ